MRVRNGRPARRQALQNLIVNILLIAFFLGITGVYYAMLRAATTDDIVKSGELGAYSAANQIDQYLSTGVDAIMLTGSTLDNMIRDKRSQEEILDYLENQTIATSNVVTGQSNGIYAYINGEYLDGMGWEPDEDFVATQRPWYVDAMAVAGKVAVVDPYTDVQTGETMITLAKTLCDARSVVAIDISMRELQKITEGIASQGRSEREIVLDRNYQVIAHSDRDEVGRNYAREDGTFGRALVERYREKPSNRSYFSLRYGGANYLVYAISVQNDWVCLSVIDATAAYGRMRIPLAITLAVAALMIAILVIVLVRSGRKEALAERMRQLAAQQSEFAHYDQMTGLRNRRAYAEELEKLSGDLPEGCCVVMIDVNGLKAVNDTLGHEAGDELIIAAANCIHAAFEGVETIYRIGGDEFCVITIGTEEGVNRRLALLEDMAARWQGELIGGFSVCCGVGSERESKDIEEIRKLADKRMYEKKSRFYRTAEGERRQDDR